MSIVVLLFAMSAGASAFITAPVYAGDVDFQELLETATSNENLNQLADQFSGFIGTSPIDPGSAGSGDGSFVTLPASAQNTLDFLAGTASLRPEFQGLSDALAAFGQRKGSFESGTEEEAVLSSMLGDVLSQD